MESANFYQNKISLHGQDLIQDGLNLNEIFSKSKTLVLFNNKSTEDYFSVPSLNSSQTELVSQLSNNLESSYKSLSNFDSCQIKSSNNFIFIDFNSFISYFKNIQFLVHEKGTGKAFNFKFNNDSRNLGYFSAQSFNKIFKHIKKSKQNIFSHEILPINHITPNGSFLASCHVYRNFDLILILGGESLLNPTVEDISFFESNHEYVAINFLTSMCKVKINSENDLFINTLINIQFPIIYCNLHSYKSISSKHTEKFGAASVNSLNSIFHRTYIKNNSNNTIAAQIFHHQRISILGELINTLRHELSNPLFAIKLGASLGISENEQDSDLTGFLTEIEASADRCLATLDNFNHIFLKSDQTISLSLTSIIDEVLLLTKSATKNIKRTILIPLDLRDQLIKVDPWALSQILFNLIINSSQAMINFKNPNPEICLRIEKLDNQLFFKISDNGPGITPENAKLIFNPFFTTKSDGTGLGLAICQALASGLGGKIWLQDDNRIGCTFILAIPIGE